jgi:signal transduction histidine kinase
MSALAPALQARFEAERAERVRKRLMVISGVVGAFLFVVAAVIDPSVFERPPPAQLLHVLEGLIDISFALWLRHGRSLRTLERTTMVVWSLSLTLSDATVPFVSPQAASQVVAGTLLSMAVIVSAAQLSWRLAAWLLGVAAGTLAIGLGIRFSNGLPPFLRPEIALIFPCVVIVFSNARERRLELEAFRSRIELERGEELRTQAALRAQQDRFLMELHDGIKGRLVRAAVVLAAADDRHAGDTALGEAASAVREALDESEAILGVLDGHGEPWGELAATIRRDLAEVCERHQLELHMEIAPAHDGVMLATTVAHALRRIAHEGLVNVIRHAQARRLDCKLALDGDVLSFTLCDDGVGFSGAAPGRGLGIISRRVEQLGGKIVCGDASSGGGSLRVDIPLTHRAQS